MADGKVCVSETALVLQTENIYSPRKRRDSFWLSTSSPSFQGSKSMVNQENMTLSESEEGSFFPPEEKEESKGEDYCGDFLQARKKRRLTVNQVEYLEKNFEVENKLESERKVDLAKELGLQPRQVAIWFQNRRARFKTKQLEKDHCLLMSSYDQLMSDYDNLLKENEDLKAKINEMKNELLEREKKTTTKKKKGNVEQLELAVAFPCAGSQNPLSNSDSQQVCNLAMSIGKQEEASSDKSDVFDSEILFNAENYSSLMEAANSSQSDFSQDEEDNFTGTLFPPVFPKLEDEEFPTSCSFGFPTDEQTFCFWPYFSSEI